MIEQVLALMKEQHEEDPLALLQPLEPGQDNAQLKIIKGFNLEITLFLAGLTGAFVYTDALLHWEHLHEHTRVSGHNVESPITDAIKSIVFPLQHDVNKLLSDRLYGGQSGTIRSLISRLLSSMLNTQNPASLNPMVTQLDSEVKKMRQKQQEQSSESVLDMQFELSVSISGFENNDIRRLIVTFGRANDIQIATIAMYLDIYQTATE